MYGEKKEEKEEVVQKPKRRYLSAKAKKGLEIGVGVFCFGTAAVLFVLMIFFD